MLTKDELNFEQRRKERKEADCKSEGEKDIPRTVKVSDNLSLI